MDAEITVLTVMMEWTAGIKVIICYSYSIGLDWRVGTGVTTTTHSEREQQSEFQ